MMAVHLGATLPPALWERLEAGALFRDGGLGVTVLTADPEGWPHVAITSCAVASRPDRILVPLGGASNSLRNIERDGKCTLMIAAPDLLIYIKGTGAVVRRELQTVPQEAAVGINVAGVWSDEGRIFAMTSGLTYKFVRHPEMLAELERDLLMELAALEA